jgi:hypothetical protein
MKEASKASKTLKKPSHHHTSLPERTTKSIFSPVYDSKVADSTKGLVAKNKKFNIHSINDLVEALVHKQRLEKEEQLQKSLESRDKNSQSKLSSGG